MSLPSRLRTNLCGCGLHKGLREFHSYSSDIVEKLPAIDEPVQSGIPNHSNYYDDLSLSDPALVHKATKPLSLGS